MQGGLSGLRFCFIVAPCDSRAANSSSRPYSAVSSISTSHLVCLVLVPALSGFFPAPVAPKLERSSFSAMFELRSGRGPHIDVENTDTKATQPIFQNHR